MRRAEQRGLVHGLSLVLLTLFVFGAVAWFAAQQAPLSCKCADGSVARGTRGGLEPIPKRCGELCQGHGGAAPKK